MSRFKLIMNPAAGTGGTESLLPIVLDELRQGGITPHVSRTECPKHAIELAKQAVADGYDTILAMGGDGTTNEVVNGLMSHYHGEPMGTLGIIPVGGGNDFCAAINWPADVRQACRRLASAQRRLIDIGKINERYFVNVAGAGFDTTVSVEAYKMREMPGLSSLRGFPLYLLAVFKTLFLNYKIPVTTIRHDDQVLVQPTLMIAVANGPRYGGGFLIAPQATADDGLFDVCVAGYLNRLGILKLLPHVMKGTHVGKKQVLMLRARRVALEGDLATCAQVDGELYPNDSGSFVFELLPKSLWVLAG